MSYQPETFYISKAKFSLNCLLILLWPFLHSFITKLCITYLEKLNLACWFGFFIWAYYFKANDPENVELFKRDQKWLRNNHVASFTKVESKFLTHLADNGLNNSRLLCKIIFLLLSRQNFGQQRMVYPRITRTSSSDVPTEQFLLTKPFSRSFAQPSGRLSTVWKFR